VRRRGPSLARDLRQGLVDLGFRSFTPAGNASSILTVHLDRNQARAREVLDAAAVQLASAAAVSLIRISPALFNTKADIRRFLIHATKFG
jgi:selenocysteine lyase/cysteine desulfurase